jgi:uncharacterized membrane protein YphA (DoxX/SURF4 family)
MLKTRSLSDFAPLVLRIVLGIIFIVHGAMKFMYMSRTEHLFSKLSIPLPGIAAPAIALLEVIGGIALILGLGSRFFALLLAIDMLVAIAIAKQRKSTPLPAFLIKQNDHCSQKPGRAEKYPS